MAQHPANPEGERKQVTTVFFDLVGFSEVASVTDAEDLQSWLEGYYRQSREIVAANGGEVTEYLGDGVVAVFGLSHAHELAAAKAVDAALTAVTRIAAPVAGAHRMVLRAGIATGEVAVRDAGGAGGFPRITGMVTTLAQRVQEQAEPGSVLIAESTRRLLRGQYALTPLPDQHLKGFAEPQTLYRPAARPQGEVAQMAGELIGRSREIATLEAAEKPVLIVGEAGIGKTALATHVARKAPAFAVFHADGIHSGSSYQPFKDWLARHLDDAAPSFDALCRGFPGMSQTDHLSLALVMGLAEGQALLTELSNYALKARNEAALWRAIRAVQTDGMLVFEDLHWFDIASFGVIQHILDSPERAGYRLILTSREDPKLGRHLSEDDLTILALDPLPDREAAQLLTALSGGQLDAAATSRLVDRAGGVPLYLEQLLKHGRRAPGKDEAVPETLMDLLAQRIDETGPAKPVLQRASAIGRVFRRDLLVALDPEGADPTPALERGVEAGVLVRQSETEWAFAHALLVQAAYQSVLRKSREMLHARIVEALRHRLPGLPTSDPAILAGHQMKAGQTIPAIQSYLSASQWALLRGAFADAEAHARTALGLCADLGEADAAADLAIACHTALGSILMQVQGFTAEPVRDAFEAVHRIARSRPTLGKASAPALLGSFTHAIIAGHKDRADGFSDMLTALAESLPGDADGVEVRLAALAARNSACFYQGDFRTQFRQIAVIRKLYRIENHAAMIAPYGMDIFAAAQMFEAPARAIVGEVDKVAALVAETDAHQAALNIPVMLPYALIWGAVPLFYAGQQAAALERLHRGMALAHDQGAAFWQLTGQTWDFVMDPEKSASPEGLDAFGANVQSQRQVGANVAGPYFMACYADRLAAAGRLSEAYQMSSAAVAEARESGLHCWYAEILRMHASICRRDNHPGEADAALKLAIDTSKRQGAALWTLRTMLEMAEAEEEIRADLSRTVAAFPPGAETPELGRARLLLAS